MKHPGLLAKAKEVGDKLMYAFNTDTGREMTTNKNAAGCRAQYNCT